MVAACFLFVYILIKRRAIKVKRVVEPLVRHFELDALLAKPRDMGRKIVKTNNNWPSVRLNLAKQAANILCIPCPQGSHACENGTAIDN